MAISFIGSSDEKIESFNKDSKNNFISRVDIVGPMIVPFQTGPRRYNLIDGEWRKIQAGVLAASDISNSVELFKNWYNPGESEDTGFGSGRSLFGDFNFRTIDGLKLKDSGVFIGDDISLADINEVLLHFYYDSSETQDSKDLTWIDTCISSE